MDADVLLTQHSQIRITHSQLLTDQVHESRESISALIVFDIWSLQNKTFDVGIDLPLEHPRQKQPSTKTTSSCAKALRGAGITRLPKALAVSREAGLRMAFTQDSGFRRRLFLAWMFQGQINSHIERFVLESQDRKQSAPRSSRDSCTSSPRLESDSDLGVLCQERLGGPSYRSHTR